MPNGCGKLCPFLASILVDRAGEADVHIGITLGKQGDEIIIRGDLVLVIEIEWYCRFTVFSKIVAGRLMKLVERASILI